MSISIGNISRLKSKIKIGLLFEKGKRLSAGSLALRYLSIDSEEASEFGFSVPKKKQSLAVDRNRTKRLMRECLRTQAAKELQNGKVIMFVYLGNSTPELVQLNQQMNSLLKKLTNETS